jgi:chemotaxis protein methyltransferase WspC
MVAMPIRPPRGAAAPGRPAAPPALAPPPPRDLLAEAAELADRGDLEAASVRCEERLRVAGPEAAAYFMLGVIRQGQGLPDRAEECFGRALYCDPGHYESLVHLALLVAGRGDSVGAANLRRRAERARHEGSR